MTITKVVLADDHPFLIEGIQSVVRSIPQVEIAATVTNGFDLMETMLRVNPDLVLLDLNMPGYDGLQCLEKIKSGFSSTKVLILTSYSQPELIEELRRKQADGYLIKDSTAQQLKDAITSVLAGQKHFPTLTQKAESGVSFFFDDFLKKFSLTKREVDIIRLICAEMSSKEIASKLFLSELTITTHRRNIFRKLDVKNVAGLMNFAKENRLI